MSKCNIDYDLEIIVEDIPETEEDKKVKEALEERNALEYIKEKMRKFFKQRFERIE